MILEGINTVLAPLDLAYYTLGEIIDHTFIPLLVIRIINLGKSFFFKETRTFVTSLFLIEK